MDIQTYLNKQKAASELQTYTKDIVSSDIMQGSPNVFALKQDRKFSGTGRA